MFSKTFIKHNPAVGLIALLLVSCVLFPLGGSLIAVFTSSVPADWSYWQTVGAVLVNSLIFALVGLLARPFVTGSLQSSTPSHAKAGIYFSVLIIALLIQPLVECCAVVNQLICQIPFVYSIVGEPDHTTDAILLKILTFNSPLEWGVALVVVALAPAIAEEMCFRWAMQPALRRLMGNWHGAVVATAIIFSAFHGDAYGFLSRALLGGIMGALFFITRDIRPSIIFHFANNAMVVISVGMADLSPAEILNAEPTTPNVFVALLSTALALGELYCVDLVCRHPEKIDEILNGGRGEMG